MLNEIWERLRGYDKWTPAVATVKSTSLEKVGIGGAAKERESAGQIIGWQAVCKIGWRDLHGNEHAASFEAFEESPLYQLCEGDTLNIRFNPKNPSKFYLRPLVESHLARVWKVSIFALLLAVVFTGFAVAWFGPALLTALSR